MTHVVLLGDSVFDNGAYVASGVEVIAQLRSRLPPEWEATLGAVDGAVIAGVHRQLAGVPATATHLVISAGGNDALGYASLLREGARSVVDALARLAAVRERFAEDYARLLDAATARGLPTALCTIYNARFPDPEEMRLAATALTLLNDVITAEAARRRLPVLDLRVMFDDPRDYANAIEPSGHGGRKMVEAMLSLLAGHDFSGPAALFSG